MHDKTIVALFDDHAEAQQVLTELRQQKVAHDPETRTARDLESGTAEGRLPDMLTSRGVPESDAHVYAEGVRRGGTLITVLVDNDEIDRVAAVLERHNLVDIDQRGHEYRRAGSEHAAETRGETRGETVVPVAEESLDIGKRDVERGRVRIHSHAVEQPVEQQVNLRDETVHVERRRVDPTRGPVGPDAFEEKTFEVTERGEEPVVAKTGRVTEEVVVSKDAGEHTERVGDTVRKTDVEVERDDASREALRRSGDKKR